MSWPLSEACLRVEARRLAARACAAPLVAAVAACAWLGSSALALRAGSTAAHALSPLLLDLHVARVVVLSLALSASAAGAALGLTAPGITALGGTLAAAPVPPRVALAAVASARLTAVTLLAAPPLVAAVAPVAVAGPGGVLAGSALVAALCACAVAGASLAELALRLARQRIVRRAHAISAAIALSAAATCECAASGVAGSAPASVTALLASVAVGVLGARTWLDAALERPVAMPGRGRGARQRWRRILPVLESAALAVLLRAPDIRLALATGAGFGLVGMGAASVAGDAGSGLLLAAGVAALAAGLAPLSAGGRVELARWAWSAASPGRAAAGWAVASGLAMTAALAPVVLVAGVLGATMPAMLQSAHAAVVVGAAALVAGAFVPRRAAGLGDDAAALAAFVTVVALFLAGGEAARSRLAAFGVAEAIGMCLWLLLACTVAVGALRRRVRLA